MLVLVINLNPTLDCSNVIKGSTQSFLFCNTIKTLYRLREEHGNMLLRETKMTHLFIIILTLIYFFLKTFCLLKFLPTDSGRRLK